MQFSSTAWCFCVWNSVFDNVSFISDLYCPRKEILCWHVSPLNQTGYFWLLLFVIFCFFPAPSLPLASSCLLSSYSPKHGEFPVWILLCSWLLCQKTADPKLQIKAEWIVNGYFFSFLIWKTNPSPPELYLKSNEPFHSASKKML